MTTAEQGFLLLTSHLGNPQRKPLTLAQFRTLSHRVQNSPKQIRAKDLHPSDLLVLGYGPEDAMRIVSLLEDGPLLHDYLSRGKSRNCYPLTRISSNYPQQLRLRLGADAPLCLWYKGDLSTLSQPSIGLVGSRNLSLSNNRFAQQAGLQAAKQGYALVSGNAKGADMTAQNSCIQQNGHVISIVADTLVDKIPSEHILYLSEDSYDLPFSAFRALSRNRIIHALGDCTLVAQCELETGGSWDGSVKNLENNCTPLHCFNDGSAAAKALQDRGADLIGIDELNNLAALCNPQPCIF